MGLDWDFEFEIMSHETDQHRSSYIDVCKSTSSPSKKGAIQSSANDTETLIRVSYPREGISF